MNPRKKELSLNASLSSILWILIRLLARDHLDSSRTTKVKELEVKLYLTPSMVVN